MNLRASVPAKIVRRVLRNMPPYDPRRPSGVMAPSLLKVEKETLTSLAAILEASSPTSCCLCALLPAYRWTKAGQSTSANALSCSSCMSIPGRLNAWKGRICAAGLTLLSWLRILWPKGATTHVSVSVVSRARDRMSPMRQMPVWVPYQTTSPAR